MSELNLLRAELDLTRQKNFDLKHSNLQNDTELTSLRDKVKFLDSDRTDQHADMVRQYTEMKARLGNRVLQLEDQNRNLKLQIGRPVFIAFSFFRLN